MRSTVFQLVDSFSKFSVIPVFYAKLALSYDFIWRVNISVHDGWGHSEVEKGNAVHAGTTTNMDTLGKEGDLRYIAAHGLSVGLNDGLMGNSEVGCGPTPFPSALHPFAH